MSLATFITILAIESGAYFEGRPVQTGTSNGRQSDSVDIMPPSEVGGEEWPGGCRCSRTGSLVRLSLLTDSSRCRDVQQSSEFGGAIDSDVGDYARAISAQIISRISAPSLAS